MICYANILYDENHKIIIIKNGYEDIKKVSSQLNISDRLKQWCQTHINNIESAYNTDLFKEIKLKEYPLGRSKNEKAYRRWCLNNRLFLNPLNDLGPITVASTDILHIQNIARPIDEGPIIQGMFNQIKQEYVSARYLYYEGITQFKPHFSDKNVLLINTLDYPSYSLSIEKIKASFRIIYGLYDKMAFLLNYYFELKIEPKKIKFKTFWYEKRRKDNGIRCELTKNKNWPLWGLYWLSKDLFEEDPDFQKSIEPDAKKVKEIRDYLEHKYIKIHEDMFKNNEDVEIDIVEYSIYRTDFEKKTLRLIKNVRAAIIYLSLSLHEEETIRAQSRSPDIPIVEIEMDNWEDEWKL